MVPANLKAKLKEKDLTIYFKLSVLALLEYPKEAPLATDSANFYPFAYSNVCRTPF